MIHATAIAHTLRTAEAIPDRAMLHELLGLPLIEGTVLATKLEKVHDLVTKSADTQVAVNALGNGVLAEEAVPVALFSYLRSAPDFASVIRNSVLCGGDTDTIAAMSGALCGALVGGQDLPLPWLQRLENGRKGADYLRTLADATFEMWQRRSPHRGHTSEQ